MMLSTPTIRSNVAANAARPVPRIVNPLRVIWRFSPSRLLERLASSRLEECGHPLTDSGRAQSALSRCCDGGGRRSGDTDYVAATPHGASRGGGKLRSWPRPSHQDVAGESSRSRARVRWFPERAFRPNRGVAAGRPGVGQTAGRHAPNTRTSGPAWAVLAVVQSKSTFGVTVARSCSP
jgi:hypothetical protein